MALAVPLLGPAIALHVLQRSVAEHRVPIRIAAGILALHLVGLFGLAVVLCSEIYKLRQFQYKIHVIYSAIATWQSDHHHESVPDHLVDLVRQGYISQLPTNPYTGRPIREVALNGEAHPGDVTYLPVYNLAPDEYAYASSFGLFGYGPARYQGISTEYSEYPEHVVITLDAGLDLKWYEPDGDGMVGSKHCQGGLTCRETVEVYRKALNRKDRDTGWVTAAEYHKLKAKQRHADATP